MRQPDSELQKARGKRAFFYSGCSGAPGPEEAKLHRKPYCFSVMAAS